MEFRITLDDDITSSVNSLAALFDLASENGDEVLQYCYDHHDDFLLWLNSVDNNRAKILSACQRQIGEYGLEYFSFVLKANAKSVGLIEKKWKKDHPPKKETIEQHVVTPPKNQRQVSKRIVSEKCELRKKKSSNNGGGRAYAQGGGQKCASGVILNRELVGTRIKSSKPPASSIGDWCVCTVVNNGKTIVVRGEVCSGEVRCGMRVRILPAGNARGTTDPFLGNIVDILYNGHPISHADPDDGEVALRIDIEGFRSCNGIAAVSLDTQCPQTASIQPSVLKKDAVQSPAGSPGNVKGAFYISEGRVCTVVNNGKAIVVRGVIGSGEAKYGMRVRILPIGNARGSADPFFGDVVDILYNGHSIHRADPDDGEIALRIDIEGSRSFNGIAAVSLDTQCPQNANTPSRTLKKNAIQSPADSIEDVKGNSFYVSDGRVLCNVKGRTIVVSGHIHGGMARMGMEVRIAPVGANRVFKGLVVEILKEGHEIANASWANGEVALRINIIGSRSFGDEKAVTIDCWSQHEENSSMKSLAKSAAGFLAKTFLGF